MSGHFRSVRCPTATRLATMQGFESILNMCALVTCDIRAVRRMTPLLKLNDRLQGFLQAATSMGIATMASGGKAPVFRFYMYAKPQAKAEFLMVETIVDKGAGSATVTIKSEDPSSVPAFADVYRSCLNGMTR